MTFLTCEGRLGTTVRAMGVQLPGTVPGAMPEKRLGLRDSSPVLNICWCLWKIRLGLFCSQPWTRLVLFVKLVMDGVHTGSWEAACPDQAAGLHLLPCCCTICISTELSQENEGMDGSEEYPCSFILELSCPGVCLFDGYVLLGQMPCVHLPSSLRGASEWACLHLPSAPSLPPIRRYSVSQRSQRSQRRVLFSNGVEASLGW